MAEYTEVIKIQYDTDEAVNKVNDLTKAIAANQARQKELKEQLKDNKISQQDYSVQMAETTQTLNRDSFERKKYINVLQAEVNSVKRAKAENQILREERNKLSTATAEGRKKIEIYNKKIDANTKVIKGNVDQQSRLYMNLGKINEGLSKLPGPIGFLSRGIGEVGSMLAKLGPIGAGVAVAVGALAAPLTAFFTKSEKGFEMMERKMAGMKAAWGVVVGELIKGGEKITESFDKQEKKATKWQRIMSGLGMALGPAFTAKLTAMGVEMDLASDAAEKFTGKMQELDDLTREMIVPRAIANNQIAAAKLLYEDETKTIEERIGALKRSLDIEIEVNQKEIEHQKQVVANIQKQNKLKQQAGQLRDADLEKEEQAKARVIELETTSMQKRSEVSSKLKTAKEELERGSLQVMSEIKTEESDIIIEDMDKIMKEYEEFGEKRAEMDIEQSEAFIERYTEQQERLKEIQQQTLDDMYIGMQELIVAAGDMGDERVNIALDAASKLSTINWQNVDDSKEAFLAIGQAAQGLTSLITAGNQRELDDAKAKYEADVQMAGDNVAQKEIAERRYNKKLAAIKKQQFKEEKALALVNAAIATALAVVKMLSAGFPIGIVMAALAAVAGGVQIATIARQKEPTFTSGNFSEGGNAWLIGGRPHSQGGTKFVGDDGTKFEAQRDEGLFILKKEATAEIAALSAINESHGGRSLFDRPVRHAAEGGQVASATGIDTSGISQAVRDGMAGVTIVTQVSDIKTGLTERDRVINAGVI